MANTLKQGVERLKEKAGTVAAPEPEAAPPRKKGAAKNTVMIGGHFPRPFAVLWRSYRPTQGTMGRSSTTCWPKPSTTSLRSTICRRPL
jgi:hypothetical protein